jgi:transposase
MLTLSPAVKIYLSTAPTDMRKGHDGLRAIVEQHLGEDVYSGHLFVFVSRRRDRVKILAWDRGGFVLWYKRLEQGRFKMPRVDLDQRSVHIDAGQLAMLLDGLDFSRVRRPRRWEPPPPQARSKGIDRSAKV